MPTDPEIDKRYMSRVLELATRAKGLTSPNPMVGAVIVKKNRVIGEGFHRGPGEPHAEIDAIQNATENVAGATIYVNLEPCSHHGRTPPCADALVQHRPARIVIASNDPNPQVSGKGVEILQQAGIKVDSGICGTEARRLNEAFFVYHLSKRPFFMCKWAMTLDGRIATRIGHSKWISNEKSRNYVHELRGQTDAVMVGIGTVLMDDPILNVRLENYTGRQPKRIVVDGHLRIPLRAKCLLEANAGQCIVATTEAAPKERLSKLRDAGHEVLVLRGRRGIIDLKYLIRELHRLEIQSVLCEGGSGMFGSLLEAELVDKVVAFIGPKLVGGSASKAPISGWGVHYMHKAVTFEDVQFRQFDEDLCIEAYVASAFRRLRPFRGTVHLATLDAGENIAANFSGGMAEPLE